MWLYVSALAQWGWFFKNLTQSAAAEKSPAKKKKSNVKVQPFFLALLALELWSRLAPGVVSAGL